MVPFIVVKKIAKNPADTKYYPKAASYGIIEVDDLCKEISNASSLTRGDVKNTVESLIDGLQQHLSQGQLVRLPGIGLFGISFSTKAEDSKEKVDADNVKNITLSLRPDTKMRDVVKNFSIGEYDPKNLLRDVTTGATGNGN